MLTGLSFWQVVAWSIAKWEMLIWRDAGKVADIGCNHAADCYNLHQID